MLSWIAANIGTIIICAVLFAIVAPVIAVMARTGKKTNPPAGASVRIVP